MIRHHKSGKEIWSRLVCTDDFGNQVYVCHYTGQLVSTAEAIILGACIPQAIGTYVCARDATEAFKDAKRAFDELDANCNACINFVRLKHDKDPLGLVRGSCGKGKVPTVMVYRISAGEFWVHPEDHMGLSCWEARPKKVK